MPLSNGGDDNGNGMHGLGRSRRRKRGRASSNYYDVNVALALTNLANIGRQMVQQKNDEMRERASRDNRKEMTENEKYQEYVKRVERIRIENNVKLELTRLLGGRTSSDLTRQINQILWYEELSSLDHSFFEDWLFRFI